MLKKSFDVVIIDLDSDPEYTLALVESISTDAITSVIVYSEKVDPGLMVRCLRAGAREYLHTPITPAAMTEALVRAGHDGWKLPRQLSRKNIKSRSRTASCSCS